MRTLPTPILAPLGDKWELRRGLTVELLGILVRIPCGYVCDLASVPAFAWASTYPPSHPLVALAALVHDWLYQSHECTRSQADAVFHELLILGDCSRWRAWLMWAAVRVFGGPAWRHRSYAGLGPSDGAQWGAPTAPAADPNKDTTPIELDDCRRTRRGHSKRRR